MNLDWQIQQVWHKGKSVDYWMFRTNRYEGGFCANSAFTDICIEDKAEDKTLGFTINMGGATKDIDDKCKALTEDILDKIAAGVHLSNEFSYSDYARRYGLDYEKQRTKKPDGYKKTGNSLGSLWRRMKDTR